MLRAPSARGPNSILPSNHPTTCSSASSAATHSEQVVAIETLIGRADSPQKRLYLLIAELRAQIRCRASRRGRQRPGAAVRDDDARSVARPQGTTGIAGSRLNPDTLEGAFAQEPAVPDAIERHATGKAEIIEPVSRWAVRAMRSMTSSHTAWIDRARSISRCVNGVSGARGGPPNSSSNAALVIVRPPR